MARKQTVQIEDGKWYALGGYDRQICCDCGLHHTLEYKLENGRIYERVKRDDRATALERADQGITLKRKVKS